MDFELEKMKRLTEEDLLLKRMVADLIYRNGDAYDAYRVVFNSEVLSDSVMEERYKSI